MNLIFTWYEIAFRKWILWNLLPSLSTPNSTILYSSTIYWFHKLRSNSYVHSFIFNISSSLIMRLFVKRISSEVLLTFCCSFLNLCHSVLFLTLAYRTPQIRKSSRNPSNKPITTAFLLIAQSTDKSLPRKHQHFIWVNQNKVGNEFFYQIVRYIERLGTPWSTIPP